MQLLDPNETIVAVASAPGGAARGVIRLSGPQALDCLLERFRPDSAQRLPESAPASLTGALDLPPPLGPLPCRVYVWPTVRSYTRQPTAEIHTLGSRPLLEATLAEFCLAGARLAEPGEFTLRAFLAGRIDLTQAEAVLGVIDATNQRQLDVALSQLAGGLSGSLGELRRQLLDLCADIEAGLDFVDEDIEFVSSGEVVHQLDRISSLLNSTLEQISLRGQSAFHPRIVLRGRPNAGKSTLWNALVNDAAAIVSDQPGTTRDYLEGETDVHGMTCQLIDTAGVDPGLNSGPETAAQAVADRKHREADLSVLCIDGSLGAHTWDAQQLLGPSPPNVIAVTKSDLPSHALPTILNVDTEIEHAGNVIRVASAEGTREFEKVHVSGQWGTGLDALRRTLRDQLEAQMNNESSVVAHTAARCLESLRLARTDLQSARELAARQLGDELVAAEIRNAMNELGKVVGAVYTEDVLDQIFSRFCIGK